MCSSLPGGAYVEMKDASRNTTAYSDIRASDHARVQNGDAYYGSVTYNFTQQMSPQNSPQSTGHKHWLIKRPPNRLFTGREDILSEMESCLLEVDSAKSHVLKHYVLSGIGGVGKSEIALQFAHRNRQKYWGVFWIDFRTLETAQRSFEYVANTCGWEIGSGEQTTETVIQELSNSILPWLMVLDNCDDDGIDYSDFIPNAPVGTLLITTRLEDVRRYGDAGSYLVEGLSEESAAELLFKAARKTIPGTDDEYAAAKSIVEQLGCHTLAVTVAASLVKDRYTLQEYSFILQQKYAELLRTQPRQAKSTYGTIEATFDISARRLAESGEQCDAHALELLQILAYFDRTDIPEDIFTRAWRWGRDNQNNTDTCEPEATEFDIDKLSSRYFQLALSFAWADPSDHGLFRQARARLADLSLLLRTWHADGTSSMSMHPVLHSWARNRLLEPDRSHVWQVAAATLALSAENSFHPRQFTFQLRPHLEFCWDARPLRNETLIPRGFYYQTLHLFWWQLYRADSRHVVSIMAEIRALLPSSITECSEQTLDSLSLDILAMQAHTLKFSGDHSGALAIRQRLVHAHKEVYEPLDARLQMARINLSDTLIALGRHDDAANIIESLQETHVGLPPTHNIRLLALERLGNLYLNLDKPEKAMVVLEEAREARKRLPGWSFMYDWGPQRNLAIAYARLDQHLRAVGLLEEVAEATSKIYPPGHRGRWVLEIDLVLSYTKTGKLEEARRMLEGMMPFLNQQTPAGYGSYHVAETMLLVEEGRITHVETMQEQLVERNIKTLSLGDRDRYEQEYKLVSYHIGARNHIHAGLQLDRIREYEHLLSRRERECLVELEKRLCGLNHLIAVNYHNQDRLDLALPLQEKVVEIRSNLLPPQDHGRNVSEQNLVHYYLKAGRAREARRQLDRMLEYINVLAADRGQIEEIHRDLLRLEHRLAVGYYREGRLDQAIAMQEKVVEAESRLLPSDDLERWFSVSSMILYYAAKREFEKARDLVEAASLPLLHQPFKACANFERLDLATAAQEKVADAKSKLGSIGCGKRWDSVCALVFQNTQAETREMAKVLIQKIELPLLYSPFLRLTYKVGRSWCCTWSLDELACWQFRGYPFCVF